MVKKIPLIMTALMVIWITSSGAFGQHHEGAKVHEGVIIKVVSAGELVLWEKGQLHPFKLYGIALPDPQTPLGLAAKKKVSDMVFNTLLLVHLVRDDTDKPPGIVMIRGKCLNQELVRSGTASVAAACSIPEFCRQWKAFERRAKEEKTGIWSSGK